MDDPDKKFVLVVSNNSPDGRLEYMNRLIEDRLKALGRSNQYKTLIVGDPEDKKVSYCKWVEQQIQKLAEEKNNQIMAAVVDLCFHNQDGNLQEGLEVAKILKSFLPQCFRILVAGYIQRYSIECIKDVNTVISLAPVSATFETQMHHALNEAFRYKKN